MLKLETQHRADRPLIPSGRGSPCAITSKHYCNPQRIDSRIQVPDVGALETACASLSTLFMLLLAPVLSLPSFSIPSDRPVIGVVIRFVDEGLIYRFDRQFSAEDART